jgi:hypothetical protein
MRLLLVAIFGSLLCASVAAQDKIYKVRLPDGRVLFTDTPPPGATIEAEREAPPPPPVPPPPPNRDAQMRSLRQQAKQVEDRARDRTEKLNRAYAAVQTAEADLATARQQLEAGREQQPGERIATARGGTRTTPAYEERIAGLERAVTEAEQRLAKANEDLNAAR